MTDKNHGKPGVASPLEKALRYQLSLPGNAAKEAVGWDSPSVSRFLSGRQGVTISKIDTLIEAAGYVVVDREFFEAMRTMAEIGVDCHCARGMGGGSEDSATAGKCMPDT